MNKEIQEREEYTCEFEEYYYKIFDSGKEMMPYLEKYYQKLPGFWAKYFREEYEREEKRGDTLGQRISFLKNRLGHLCMSHNIHKKAKRINTQIYCKDTSASTQWGCLSCCLNRVADNYCFLGSEYSIIF